MVDGTPVSTISSRERYFEVRDQFERKLWYHHLGHLEAVTLLMEGRCDLAIQRLYEDGLAGNPALRKYVR